MWVACGPPMRATKRPRLIFEADSREPESGCLRVEDVDSDLIASLGRCARAGSPLQSVLRVRVVEEGVPKGESLPDVFGRNEVLGRGIQFVPHFPFEPGIRYRASFDPRPLGIPELSEVTTLEFSLPRELSAVLTQVSQLFPSSESLPENLLRFYVCFSESMQRGRADEHIELLGPDGRPAPDVLYRPPVELWDRGMRNLTILLDPGRLKRAVGPNRELGQPLKVGERYTLVIGSGMLDLCGRPLRQSYHKAFQVAEAIRSPVTIEQWKILPPLMGSRQPLALLFPQPLDWALLWHGITVVSKGGQPMPGQVAVEQDERRWSFIPASPWIRGSYYVRIAVSLEDVCGNNIWGAFDRPLRSGAEIARERAGRLFRLLPFDVLDADTAKRLGRAGSVGLPNASPTVFAGSVCALKSRAFEETARTSGPSALRAASKGCLKDARGFGGGT